MQQQHRCSMFADPCQDFFFFFFFFKFETRLRTMCPHISGTKWRRSASVCQGLELSPAVAAAQYLAHGEFQEAVILATLLTAVEIALTSVVLCSLSSMIGMISCKMRCVSVPYTFRLATVPSKISGVYSPDHNWPCCPAAVQDVDCLCHCAITCWLELDL